MARFTAILLGQTTTNLRRLILMLKETVKEPSNYWRIQRFLCGYALNFTQLGGLLTELFPQDPPYVAVLDRTEGYFRQTPVNVLMIGVATGVTTSPKGHCFSYKLDGAAG